MPQYRDSVGNTYTKLPPKPPQHSAKAAGSKTGRQNRNHAAKYVAYRNKIGKPRGPGVAGNKAGKNR